MHMEPIIKAQDDDERHRYPEVRLILAILVLSYVDAAVRLIFG